MFPSFHKLQHRPISQKPAIIFLLCLLGMLLMYSCKSDAASTVPALNKKTASILTGETVRLTVTGASGQVTWSSSNKKIAVVNSKGRVRGKSAGTVRIRAKIRNVKKGTVTVLRCTVTVSPVVDCRGKLQGSSNREMVYRYLTGIGFTAQAAAAVVGNLMYESGSSKDICLNAVERATGRGVGMCQWTNTADAQRRTNFISYCQTQGVGWPNTSLRVQVNFLMKELYGDYGNLWYFLSYEGYPSSYQMSFKSFRKCTDLNKAVAVFCANFERPYAVNAGLTVRCQYAAAVYWEFSSVS